MSNLVRTTIALPEETLRLSKIIALEEKRTLNEVIREALETRLYGKRKKAVAEPQKLLGQFSLGIGKIFRKRSEIYEEHLKRKLAF